MASAPYDPMAHNLRRSNAPGSSSQSPGVLPQGHFGMVHAVDHQNSMLHSAHASSVIPGLTSPLTASYTPLRLEQILHDLKASSPPSITAPPPFTPRVHQSQEEARFAPSPAESMDSAPLGKATSSYSPVKTPASSDKEEGELSEDEEVEETTALTREPVPNSQQHVAPSAPVFDPPRGPAAMYAGRNDQRQSVDQRKHSQPNKRRRVDSFGRDLRPSDYEAMPTEQKPQESAPPITLSVTLPRERAKALISTLHKAGYSYPALLEESLDPSLLKGIYDELGIPVTLPVRPAAVTSGDKDGDTEKPLAAPPIAGPAGDVSVPEKDIRSNVYQSDSTQTGSKAAALPSPTLTNPPAKTILPTPVSREEYLARLAAAKTKRARAEPVISSALKDSAPGAPRDVVSGQAETTHTLSNGASVPQPITVSTAASSMLSGNSQELLRTRLATLREQAFKSLKRPRTQDEDSSPRRKAPKEDTATTEHETSQALDVMDIADASLPDTSSNDSVNEPSIPTPVDMISEVNSFLDSVLSNPMPTVSSPATVPIPRKRPVASDFVYGTPPSLTTPPSEMKSDHDHVIIEASEDDDSSEEDVPTFGGIPPAAGSAANLAANRDILLKKSAEIQAMKQKILEMQKKKLLQQSSTPAPVAASKPDAPPSGPLVSATGEIAIDKGSSSGHTSPLPGLDIVQVYTDDAQTVIETQSAPPNNLSQLNGTATDDAKVPSPSTLFGPESNQEELADSGADLHDRTTIEHDLRQIVTNGDTQTNELSDLRAVGESLASMSVSSADSHGELEREGSSFSQTVPEIQAYSASVSSARSAKDALPSRVESRGEFNQGNVEASRQSPLSELAPAQEDASGNALGRSSAEEGEIEETDQASAPDFGSNELSSSDGSESGEISSNDDAMSTTSDSGKILKALPEQPMQSVATDVDSDYEPQEVTAGAESIAVPSDEGNDDDNDDDYEPPETVVTGVDLMDVVLDSSHDPSGAAARPSATRAHQSAESEDTSKVDIFTPYESPLRQFHNYRLHPKFLEQVSGGFRSLTFSHSIDPINAFCEYETNAGTCNDPECDRQHFHSIGLTDRQILWEIYESALMAHSPPPGMFEFTFEHVMERANEHGFAAVVEELLVLRRLLVEDNYCVISNTAARN